MSTVVSWSTRRVAALLLIVYATQLAQGQSPVAVTLISTTSPSAGEPGVTNMSVTGSNFPTGAIAPANVTVTLKPASGGATVATPATAVTTVAGTTRRVSFTIPGTLSVASPKAYGVTLSGTSSTGTAFASSNSAALTVNPAASITTAAPNSGTQGQTLAVAITGSYSNWLQGSTVAALGTGITVNSMTVADATHATANITIGATSGPHAVTLTTGAEVATLANGFTVTGVPPTISDFNPKTGPIGTLVAISGANFGVAPQVTTPKLGGGTVGPPPSSVAGNSVSFVVPAGAATGPINVSTAFGNATSAASFTVTPSTSFTPSVTPASATLIQGQSVSYSVSLASTNGFNELAQLSLSGAPSGITASFKPTSITAGQTSVLTLTAPNTQSVAMSNLSVSAAATIDGLPITQSIPATLSVVAPTTTLVGRTVVANSLETPLAGVTITTLGQDGNGNTTGCTGFSAVSDGAGNFALSNLPLACTGPQLIGFNGTTATAPAGTYAGVNLVFSLTSGQVTASPVLVHLPRIDNVETFLVTQNSGSNQSYSFTTIPGLSVTVYAGTTFTMPDGTRPNPFPLAAVQVPVDRLPDAKPFVPTMIRAFIVAFQPANATTNQPVAVYFPNTLSTPPGTDMALMTLDPTHGQMVPYGTGAVSANGTQIVPDPDPAHPGHLYGLVHFDWHGPMPQNAPAVNPSPPCPTCQPQVGGYVDLSSGIDVIRATDIAINGPLGRISIDRILRTMSSNPGPFGIGSGFNYGYQIGTQGVPILIMPDGNQFMFNIPQNGGLTNNTVPGFAGAVLTSSGGTYNLRWKDGTVYQFQNTTRVAYLTAIIDPNGNTMSLTLNGSDQVVQVTDPVGRSLNLAYDGLGRITSVTDNIGRIVRYTYNSAGYLATVADPLGGVTTYSYNGQSQLASVQDARGVLTEQNTYDLNSRVLQQVQADGGIYQLAYGLINPLVGESPVFLTTVTDPRGNQTTYRFGTFPFFTDATDPTGQTKSFVLDPAHNNLVEAVLGAAVCPTCGDPTQGNQSFTRDSNGNILTSTDQLGNTTTFTYDPVFNNVTSITDPLGNTTRLAYDGHGNLLAITDPNGNNTTFTYTSAGQVAQITDPVNQKTALAYDAYGDLVTITDALGNTTTILYDAVSRPLAAVDALGRKTSLTYDVLDRVVAQSNAQNNATRFGYDSVGNLLSLTDARGNTTLFTYDPMNRITVRATPLGKADTRTYDFNGNLTSFIDRRGQTSAFGYDSLNRLTRETYQDSTVIRAYDANSRISNVNDSAGGTFAFAYDSIGRPVDSVSPYGELQYAYDSASRMTSRQVVGQASVQYSYDPADNLLNISTTSASVNRTYDPRNLVLNASRANGVSSQYNYDALARPLSITHSGPRGVLNTITYGYDAVGNRVSANASIAQPLMTQAVATGTYDSDSEQTNFSPAINTFDANGDQTSSASAGGASMYTWDSRGRLVAVAAQNGQTTIFSYDFAGNLIRQTDTGPVSTLTQTFVLDDLTNVAYVSRSDGDQYSVIAGQALDDHLAAKHASGQIEYSLTDALNSTVATVDQNGAVKGTFFYEPFGFTTASNSSYPFQFAGRFGVSPSLYYARARYYGPTLDRFVSQDSIGVRSTLNPYSYARNSPMEFVDPTGLYECTYSISQHRMTCRPNEPQHATFSDDRFVSGNNDSCACQNNPDTTDVIKHGPIPIGNYAVGLPHGKRRNLTPNPDNQMFDRLLDGVPFELHGCPNPATCSTGCIAAVPNFIRDELNRLLMAEEGSNTLHVIR